MKHPFVSLIRIALTSLLALLSAQVVWAFSGTEEVYINSAGGSVPIVHRLANSPSNNAFFCGRLTGTNDASPGVQSAGGGLLIPVCDLTADTTNFGIVRATSSHLQVIGGGAGVPGSGSYENLYVPPSITRLASAQARAGGHPYFYFVREFQSFSGSVYRIVRIRLMGNSALIPLTFTDVRLAFNPDTQAQTLGFFERGQALPSIGATIYYNGTGLLRGRWEVVEPGDSEPQNLELMTEASIPVTQRGQARRYREVGRFNMLLPAGSSVRIPGPDPKNLPSQLEGAYQILLRIEADYSNDPFINDPRARAGGIAAFAMPVLRYFVGAQAGRTAQMRAVERQRIDLIYPIAGQVFWPQELLGFQWQKAEKAAFPRSYRLEFSRRGNSTQSNQKISSFLVRGDQDHFVIPHWLKSRLGTEPMRWRVIALDEGGIQTSASEWRDVQINP